MPATFDTLLALDARLVKAGIHPLTPWWKDIYRGWYENASFRSLIARVGRGGTKSHATVKVGANEVVNGDWAVPPGEVHYWAQVSENKTEAAERFRLYEAIFTALGLRHEKAGDAIILPSLRRGVRVMACQVGAVSGFRCFGYAADEAAKWENADHSANPAAEVIASIDAMTVTYPGARSLIVSSPLSTLDFHYELFEHGTTELQLVAEAPTWIANPSITEAQCRAKSRGNERVFKREYCAIPQASAADAFDQADLEAAFRPDPDGTLGEPLLVLDPSGGHGDAFVWGTVQWCQPKDGTPPVLIVNQLQDVEGEFYGKVTIDAIIARAASRADADGARVAVSDAREELALQSGFRRRGIRYVRLPWTNESKGAAVARLRRLLAERTIVFSPKDTALLKELQGFQEKILPSGAFTYGARRAGHDDRVAVVLTALMAEREGLLSGSPIGITHDGTGATATIPWRSSDGSYGRRREPDRYSPEGRAEHLRKFLQDELDD